MATATDFDCTVEGRSSNFSECSWSSSISDDNGGDFTGGMNRGSRESTCRSPKWKKLMKKLIEQSKKSFHGSSKPLTFGYDPVSYSLNFDDGNRSDEYYSYGCRFSSQIISEC